MDLSISNRNYLQGRPPNKQHRNRTEDWRKYKPWIQSYGVSRLKGGQRKAHYQEIWELDVPMVFHIYDPVSKAGDLVELDACFQVAWWHLVCTVKNATVTQHQKSDVIFGYLGPQQKQPKRWRRFCWMPRVNLWMLTIGSWWRKRCWASLQHVCRAPLSC